jgi:hypothetical protein
MRVCARMRTVRSTKQSVGHSDRVFLSTLQFGKLARRLRTEGGMSQKTVQLVMGRLLTDEDLRLRFVERPRETLVELRDQGYELTGDEIEALVRSDPGVWPSMARRIHPRLQRCSLRRA